MAQRSISPYQVVKLLEHFENFEVGEVPVIIIPRGEAWPKVENLTITFLARYDAEEGVNYVVLVIDELLSIVVVRPSN